MWFSNTNGEVETSMHWHTELWCSVWWNEFESDLFLLENIRKVGNKATTQKHPSIAGKMNIKNKTTTKIK